MGSITLYDLPVQAFIKHLQIMSHLLSKAAEFAKEKGIDAAEVPGWKLADDMKQLSFQIQTAANTAKNTLSRIGVELPAVPDEEKTIEELQKRMADTVALLEKVDRAAVEGQEDKQVQVPIGGGQTLDVTAKTAVLSMAVPNFYFHCAMAYAILRNKGVQVGKVDWLRGGQ
jgi:uncharacterized protein